VSVEVAGEQELERIVLEGEWRHHRAHELDAWKSPARDVEHLPALVEPDDLAAQESSEIARAAGDVENPSGWERRDVHLETLESARSASRIAPYEVASYSAARRA